MCSKLVAVLGKYEQITRALFKSQISYGGGGLVSPHVVSLCCQLFDQ